MACASLWRVPHCGVLQVADFSIAKFLPCAGQMASCMEVHPARVVWEDSFEDESHTFYVGTPRYMAPVNTRSLRHIAIPRVSILRAALPPLLHTSYTLLGLDLLSCARSRVPRAQEVVRPPAVDVGGGRPSHVTYDHRVDIYSFGMLLWEVMHAQIPFCELSHVEVGRRVSRGERPPMGLHGERVVFEPIIAACWSQAPSRRPAMAEVVQSLLKLEANM
jgi:serine/threonine protein kinase